MSGFKPAVWQALCPHGELVTWRKDAIDGQSYPVCPTSHRAVR